MDKKIIEAINDEVEVVFKRYGVNLQKKGNYAVGLCPFHNEKNPSFNVRIGGSKRGQWVCHSCGVKGHDVLSFVAQMEKLNTKNDFPKVIEIASQAAGINSLSTFTPRVKPPQPELPPIFIDAAEVMSYTNTPSTLYEFLCGVFNPVEVKRVFEMYAVGGTPDKWTTYPYINADGKCVDIHLMKYRHDGHREKEGYNNNWLLYQKKQNERRASLCYFGDHLLTQRPNDPVAIVESEKSALIASIIRKDVIWLATGSLSRFTSQRSKHLKGRYCHIFPDLDGVEAWRSKLENLKTIGIDAIFEDEYIRTYATSPKDDIADIILNVIGNQKTKSI